MVPILQQKLSQYSSQKISKFLTEQLDKFKARHNIKKYKQYEKVVAINLVAVEEKLQEIQEVVDLYTNENVYNINKFASFQKMTLDRTLNIEQSNREKYKKARITINLACNIDRFHKLERQLIK